jgi:hypothetical protein
MNRIREFDIASTPHISGLTISTRQTKSAKTSRAASGGRLHALIRKSSERMGAVEPELSAAMVIAPFVIAVLAALPTFVAA